MKTRELSRKIIFIEIIRWNILTVPPLGTKRKLIIIKLIEWNI